MGTSFNKEQEDEQEKKDDISPGASRMKPCRVCARSYQAVVALRQDDGLLQAAQDGLPQVLQDPLQHRLLTDVREDAETGSHAEVSDPLYLAFHEATACAVVRVLCVVPYFPSRNSMRGLSMLSASASAVLWLGGPLIW